MRHIANILSISRMFLSCMLLFFINSLTLFVITYFLCAATDVFDGFIARKTNTQSTLGAKLDSLADCIMFIIIAIIFLKSSVDKIWIYAPYIIISACIRFISLFIAMYKFKRLGMIHTVGNKLTGLLIFLTPIVYITTNSSKFIIFVCIISILSALEETAIVIISKKLDLNRKSILTKEV